MGGGLDAATDHATTSTLSGRSRRKERASDITAGLRASSLELSKTLSNGPALTTRLHWCQRLQDTGVCQFGVHNARTDKFGKGSEILPCCNTIQISAERYQFPTNLKLHQRPSPSSPWRRYIAAAGAL